MPDAAPPLSATYARWCRTGPAHLSDRMIAEGWNHKTPAEWEFWTSLDAPPPRPLTAPDVVAGLLADVAERDERLAEVTAELGRARKQLADLSTSLDYAAGQWESNAMPHTHPGRSNEYRKVMAECARDLRYALKANAPDAASDLARDRDLAARVRAVIARYKADDVNALTAFADIMDAAGEAR